MKIAPEEKLLTVAAIPAMDQFRTRGMLATRDLAAMTDIRPGTRVLDLRCGVGGPARFLAATFGCHVTGLHLSGNFIEAPPYLSDRCAMQDLVSLHVSNALDLPFEAEMFDLVFLQHVAHIGGSVPAEAARMLADNAPVLADHDPLGIGVHLDRASDAVDATEYLLSSNCTR